jgi:response regulator RpfG family c-di-GMP phosphodiesterase
MLELFGNVALDRRVRVLDREFAAGFYNSHTDQDYFLYASFGRPLEETEQGLLHILGGNIAVALNNLFLTEEIVATQREVVLTLGEVVETRSKETAQHVKRVAEYSYLLAIKAGLSEERAQLLRMASPMHDVGKIGIPDSILFKPGKLTEEEFNIIKTHTVIGHSILKKSPRRIMRTAATIALQHHERWDGGGYPHGLVEDETHIYGRITALADVFDALACDRVYKKAWPLEDVLAYVRDQRGRQFDPVLVDIFLENVGEMRGIRDTYPD